MVIPNDVFNRVREIDSPKNVTAYGRMDFHLRKLGFSKFAWFVQDVFGHSQLANVVKQRARKKCLYLFASNFEQPAHLGGIDLSPTNMSMRRLVLCVNRNCQRLNSVHVNRCHFLDVLTLAGFGAAHFVESLFIKPVQEMNETSNQQTKIDERHSRALQRRIEKYGGSGARNLSG